MAAAVNRKNQSFAEVFKENGDIDHAAHRPSRSSDMVELSSSNITTCLFSNQTIHLNVSSVVVSFAQTWNQTRQNQSFFCKIHLVSPFSVPKTNSTSNKSAFHVHLVYQTCTKKNSVFISRKQMDNFLFFVSDYLWDKVIWTGCEPFYDPLPVYVREEKELWIVLRVNEVAEDYRMHMNISVGRATVTGSEVERKALLPKFGYIQSPGYNPESGTRYPENVHSVLTLTPPEDHEVMISVPHMDLTCKEDESEVSILKVSDRQSKISTNVFAHLTLETVGREGRREVRWRRCGTLPPVPEVLREVQAVSVVLETGSHRSSINWLCRMSGIRHCFGEGFKMLYSYHETPSSPHQEAAAGGLWNCSVPHWSQFQAHLACNLRQECISGQDEDGSSCVHQPCGQGGFVVGARCYLLGHPPHKVTYNEAKVACSRWGGYLVSFNSDAEMEMVTDVLWPRSRRFDFYIGLTNTDPDAPYMYRFLHQHGDKTIAYSTKFKLLDAIGVSYCGTLLTVAEAIVMVGASCTEPRYIHYACELDTEESPGDNNNYNNNNNNINTKIPTNPIHLPESVATSRHFPFPSTQCPQRHWTHAYLACDVQSACWGRSDVPLPTSPQAWISPTSSWCDVAANASSEVLYFVCTDGAGRVPFTLVCDYLQDCFDGSDEDFCQHPPCDLRNPVSCGQSGQCVVSGSVCNCFPACKNEIDDAFCVYDMFSLHVHFEKEYGFEQVNDNKPPAVVHFNAQHGLSNVFPIRPSNNESIDERNEIDRVWPVGDYLTDHCPETHFTCPRSGYCLPVFVRCNSVLDCPDREDETACDSYTCPGYYRCRGSAICVPPSYVCDSYTHCPQHDDELFCQFSCPIQCTCLGNEFICRQVFPAYGYKEIRYLDASHSGMVPEDLSSNTMLVYLNLQHCNITSFHVPSLPNLRILDLSHNHIQNVSAMHLDQLNNLKMLLLTSNPLVSVFAAGVRDKLETVGSLHTLNMSNVSLPSLDVSVFNPFTGLTLLNLSGSSLQALTGTLQTPQLRVLDMLNCVVTEFTEDMLRNLSSLKALYTDNFKICCTQSLPEQFNPKDCHAPSPFLSSCDHLLASGALRITLYLLVVLILLGNVVPVMNHHCAFNRSHHPREGPSTVFPFHLSVSNAVMGVYLCVLAVTDSVYSGQYVWRDSSWRESGWCRLCGFLFLLSSQVSVFLVTSMSVERCVALLSGDRCHLQTGKMPVVMCAVSWTGGLLLAAVSAGVQREEFSQTSLCIPLPLTQDNSAQQRPLYGALLVLNVILMCVVITAQTNIYVKMYREGVISLTDDRRSGDVTTSGRLISLAVTDACGWLMLGLWELSASCHLLVPQQSTSVVAVFSMFINPALNPYLYLYNVRRERLRHVQRQRLMQRLGHKPGN